jgi:flavin reductase (DIM6/NTAB) family NADH-FMN oxidoreductase RutF
MPVDVAAFRRAAGQFPTGIVVVSTSLAGVGHAMTVSAFTSVSLDPVLVLFCAEKVARFHDAVLEAGTWAVSVLGEDSEKVARWLATRGRPLEGQLDAVPHHAGPLTGSPVLECALAALECRTVAVHDGGDHSIIVGEVIGIGEPGAGRAAAGDSGAYLTSTSGNPGISGSDGPLIYHRGRYRRLAPDPMPPKA